MRRKQQARPLRRARLLLVVGAGLSTIWAAYWLWPSSAPEPDYLFDIHPTSMAVFNDLTKDTRPGIPYFEDGHFHSPAGTPLRPQDVIHDGRTPQNIDSPDFVALFRLKKGSTRADFVKASGAIWKLCDAAIAVATDGREDAPYLVPAKRGRNCDYLFPVRRATNQKPG